MLRRFAASLSSDDSPLDSSVLEAFRPGSGRDVREFLVYANSMQAYWLMPPERHSRRAALGLYSPQTMLGRILRFNMSRGWLFKERVGLAKDRLTDLLNCLQAATGESNLRVAFSVGPPRPTQKITAVLIDPDARVVAYAKIAFGAEARAALSQELGVLRDLGQKEWLSTHVPSVIGWLEWKGGDVLVLSPGPSRAAPQVLGEMHFEFLSRLHAAFKEVLPFADTKIRRRLDSKLGRLAGSIGGDWERRYEKALRHIDGQLGRTPVSTSLAHRDFAPWNTRASDGELYVFDWEAAEPGVTPGYDAFHFDAIRAALMDRPLGLRDSVSEFIHSLWPEGGELQPVLWQTYLVDMSMVYAEAYALSSGIGDHRVLEWFGHEIDDFLDNGRPSWGGEHPLRT